jgi:hypothetical protein
MKKIIHLTETDVTNIVKKILLENTKVKCCCQWSWEHCEDDGQCYWECTKWRSSCCDGKAFGGGKAVHQGKDKN